MRAPMNLVIIGASGHGKVVLSIAKALGHQVAGFADDNAAIKEHCGLPVRPLKEWPEQPGLVIAIGNPRHRQKIQTELEAKGRLFPTLVHPRAWVEPDVVMGSGTVIVAGAVVNSGARIGRGVILNTSCSVDHDAFIGDFVHICPGARLAGDVHIGEGAWIGIGSSIIQGLKVGAWTMVGAGAVVVSDVDPSCVVFGVPAQLQRRESFFR